jgi:putative membrane protein
MEYYYLKAAHLVGVVTWFSGLFYAGRLLIYIREAADEAEPKAGILGAQLQMMLRRLWYGITWPSALITLALGLALVRRYGEIPTWLWVKFGLLALLYAYHASLGALRKRQLRGDFRWSSTALRAWNEVPTLFLVGIVFLAVAKTELALLEALSGLFALTLLLLAGIFVYRKLRRGAGARKPIATE